VPWLWGGVLLMVLGGVLAALDRRYRAGFKGDKKPAEPSLHQG
jgi:cytochrome c biogenesis factor